eukprot:5044774-Prymnesium_polylepis.1
MLSCLRANDQLCTVHGTHPPSSRPRRFLLERLPFVCHRAAGAQHAHSARARAGGKWVGTHLDVCVSPEIPEEVAANDQ